MKNRMLKRLVLAAALTGTLVGLTACFPLLLGGAVGGALVATDRRTSGSVVEDEGIELRASSRIRENLGERTHINVTSYNRQVLLTGEVPSVQDRQLVEQIVSRVDNVRNIVNELGVMGNATLTLLGRVGHRPCEGGFGRRQGPVCQCLQDRDRTWHDLRDGARDRA
jgi:osmotically-inducible protein OsmY